MTLLQTRNLTRQFGGIRAVNDVSFALERGEIRGVIGPNGAGKTTLVGMICGRVLPSAGTVQFDGADITRLQPWSRVARGIVYTFQITSIFRRLTCRANVALAAQRRLTTTFGRRFALSQAALDAAIDEALAAVGLSGEAGRIAGELPYGHQRLLEIAMGLALKPALLILDEPTQGLAAGEIEGFKALVREIARTATVLLIEHNMEVVMDLADRITVLVAGRSLATGAPAAIRADAAVQAAYLGP